MSFQNAFTNIKTIAIFFHSTIQHEFLHSLGAYHVQSRADRDNYIEIKWDNIYQAKKHNFKKQSNALTYDIAYDPLSIMHYEYFAFAIDKNKPTIISKVFHTTNNDYKLILIALNYSRCQTYQQRN